MPGRALLAGAASLSWLLAASCVSTERETSSPGRGVRSEYVPPSGRGQRVSGATVLNTVQAEHVFSSASAPDRFRLQLRGPRVLSGRLYLTVLDAQGDTLHQEVLPARVLQDSVALTLRDQEISVLRGMNGFFSATRFTAPAVAPAGARPTTLSPAAWSTLRTDPRAVAFAYPATGGEHHLVYSPKLGRAVVLAE